MKKYLKRIKETKNLKILSIIFTLCILLIVLLIKGIYPFGTNTISSTDMTQSYITFYHHLYDIFHNGKSILYDFTLGMGSNIYGGCVIDGFLNPTSWLILFARRDNILYFMTFIVIIKFLSIALTTSIFVDKVFKKHNLKLKLTAVLIYTFSGYTLLNYGNLMWLDIVALFPLLCLGIKSIINENKKTLFTVTLAFILINNYNLAYMILLFLLCCVPFTIYYKAKNKRLATFQIFTGTLLAIGLSAFAFIPALIQTLTSYRMSGVVTNNTTNVYFFYKLGNILLYSTPIILSIPILKDYKKNTESKIFIYSIITTFILPLLFERINLMWHTGSYQSFPFRYGFIINFILICMMLYSTEKYDFKELKTTINIKYKKYKHILAITLLSILSIYFIYTMHNNKYIYEQFVHPTQSILLILLFILTTYILLLLINLKKNTEQNILIFNIFLAIVFSLSLISTNKEFLIKEFSDETIMIANNIKKELNIKENIYRLKDTSYSLTENYPLVTNIPSNSTFLHLINTDQVLNYKELGYSSNNTKLNDTGGTIISDTLYGTKYIISKNKINNSIYKLIKKTNNFYYYKNPYTKFIYPIKNDLKEKLESKNVFDANNILAKEILGIKNNLLQIQNNDNCTTSKDKTTCTFDINNEILYFYSEDKLSKIVVNNEEIIIPEINNEQNINYNPKNILSGIVELGKYNNKITIDLYHENNQNINYLFASLNEKDYKQAFSNLEEIIPSINKNKITITYNNTVNNKGLYIPINYDKSFIATNNNKEINIVKKSNNFIYLELEEGQNEIELKFIPKTFIPCLIVSIITLIIIILLFIYEQKRKNKFNELKFITYPIFYISILIVLLASYEIYLEPIFKTFIN